MLGASVVGASVGATIGVLGVGATVVVMVIGHTSEPWHQGPMFGSGCDCDGQPLPINIPSVFTTPVFSAHVERH